MRGALTRRERNTVLAFVGFGIAQGMFGRRRKLERLGPRAVVVLVARRVLSRAALRAGSDLYLLRALAQPQRAKASLRRELGRQPTRGELAERLRAGSSYRGR